MNTIEAVRQPSKYCQTPHLVMLIDGRPLDVVLAECAQDDELEGLISPLEGLNDMSDWGVLAPRFLSTPTMDQVLPVLVCPDCVDLSCIVVLADIKVTDSGVTWTRLGLDRSPNEVPPHRLGSRVDWIQNVGPFAFDRSSYDCCIRKFKDGALLWLRSKGAEPGNGADRGSPDG